MEHHLNITPFLFLLALVGTIELLSNKIKIPSPILLLATGILVGFIPFDEPLHLQPFLVFTIFLPPLLYGEAWFASIRELKFNFRIMVFLAFGLVIATTVLAGYGMHLIWPTIALSSAIVLGAIISPPDAVAASATIRNFNVPRRIISVLQQESLLNDATALVAYGFAVSAITTGTFSITDAGIAFAYKAVVGAAIGLICASFTAYIWKKLDNPPVEILMSLIVPYLSYTLAENFQSSGVLAVVASGMYLGYQAPQMLSPVTRIQGKAFWTMFLFGINGMVFLLTGIQLPYILKHLSNYSPIELILMAITLNVLLCGIRMIWVFVFTYLPRIVNRKILEYDPWPRWQNIFLIGWSGMRGVVSLAASLALPLTVQGGEGFPQRDLILFLTFSVIIGTTVLQGLSMPFIIRWLNITEPGCVNCDEEEARHIAMQNAVKLLEEHSQTPDGNYHPDAVNNLAKVFKLRLSHYQERTDETKQEQSRLIYDHMSELHKQILQHQRQAIISLRDEGRINDQTMHKIIEDLDLQEVRLAHN